MAEKLLVVEDAGKKFARELRRVMLYGAVDILRDFFQVPTPSERLRPGEFWALDGVNLQVDRGQCLGLIGANGSGKTTLLKLVNGIFMPDKGRIRKQGRVGALVELGAGFHPLLTGRENIYVYGQILGMSKREVRQKFDAIVNYADIGDFLDTPVKHYSAVCTSGSASRSRSMPSRISCSSTRSLRWVTWPFGQNACPASRTSLKGQPSSSSAFPWPRSNLCAVRFCGSTRVLSFNTESQGKL